MRQERYHKKTYNRKKIKLRQLLEVCEEVLVLSERLKKKDSPGNFYELSTENRPYFNKDIMLSIEPRRNLDRKYFYRLKNTDAGKNKKQVSKTRIITVVW